MVEFVEPDDCVLWLLVLDEQTHGHPHPERLWGLEPTVLADDRTPPAGNAASIRRVYRLRFGDFARRPTLTTSR